MTKYRIVEIKKTYGDDPCWCVPEYVIYKRFLLFFWVPVRSPRPDTRRKPRWWNYFNNHYWYLPTSSSIKYMENKIEGFIEEKKLRRKFDDGLREIQSITGERDCI